MKLIIGISKVWLVDYILVVVGLWKFSSTPFEVLATKSFILSFQESGGWSTEEWAKYKGKLPLMKEFTSCHWEKIRFFSADVMTVWSYCTAQNDSGINMTCTNLEVRSNPATAGRQVIVSGWLQGGQAYVEANVDSFRHRTWNHMCWSYSSITGAHKFFYNGKLIHTLSISGPVITGGDDVPISSFIIGQDPDIIDGEFDSTQLFNGEISELNIWTVSYTHLTLPTMA